MHVEDSPLVLGKANEVFKAAFSNKLPIPTHSPPVTPASHTQNRAEGERLSPICGEARSTPSAITLPQP